MTESKRKGLGGFDKVLIGCGIGCAALILLAVLGVAFGSMWFFTPGEQVTTEIIADETSLGVIRLHELADDPGTQELLARVLERITQAGQQQQREQLPPSLRWISDMQAQQTNTSGINMMIPKEMTIAYEQAEDGSSVDYVVAANPRTMVRMFKTMLNLISRGEGSANVRSEYRGHDTYAMEEEAHLAFVRSTVLFANSRRALERAIDRIEAGESGAGKRAGGYDVSASIPGGDWDVEGVVGNETGLIDTLLMGEESSAGDPGVAGELSGEMAVGEISPGEDLRLGFGFDVVSANEVTGLSILECADRQAAQRWRAVLEQRFQAMREEASERGLELEIEARTEGDRVMTELRLLGLEDLLAEMLTEPELPEEDAP